METDAKRLADLLKAIVLENLATYGSFAYDGRH
jgi:hypothetical protein